MPLPKRQLSTTNLLSAKTISSMVPSDWLILSASDCPAAVFANQIDLVRQKWQSNFDNHFSVHWLEKLVHCYQLIILQALVMIAVVSGVV